MKSIVIAIVMAMMPLYSIASDNGLTTIPSSFGLPETVSRLEALLKEKGVILFARIDHQSEAVKAGLTLKGSQLLIFGNPRIGNALMKAVPTSAIDLPMKALVWEDVDGKVWLSYNRPDFLKQRHGLGDDLLKPFVPLGTLLEKATKK